MYLKYLVKLPTELGKIVCQKKDETTYVYYQTDRIYDAEKQYTAPKRVLIGKLSKTEKGMMQPNENFIKLFPDADLPENSSKTLRSCCLSIGNHIVLSQLIKENKIDEILGMYLGKKDLGLFLDLAIYSIITENNAAQYYPDYAYSHPLFSEKMHIYSDSKVSDFLRTLTAEQSSGFLNEWNSKRNYRQKIYISYDSTNKNCQAGDIEMAEYGNAKDDKDLPIFNYSVAYDTNNKEPLFYEYYPGSINDVSQLQFMLDKASAFGYKKVGFILDRGYFSKANIEYMESCGYSYIIMAKGMASFISGLVDKHMGSFEKEWANRIPEYDVYGKTVKAKLYMSDASEKYFHLYYSSIKASNESRALSNKIDEMKQFLLSHVNQKREFGLAYERYFYLHYDKDKETFLYPEEKIEEISKELKQCGYFAIVTSEKMSAKDAIDIYKSRDASEKLFRGDKSFLGNRCLRVQSDEAASSKMFIEFVALILRCSMYTHLKDAAKEMTKKPNYMNVPAAIRELEKIEMARQLNGEYILDHAITATQKTILSAFNISPEKVRYRAKFISEELKEE